MPKKASLLSLNVITPASPYPAPPCEHCNAACCRRGSFVHERYAISLADGERGWFKQEARRYKDRSPLGRGFYVWGIPYNQAGNCICLGDDNQCQIYAKRPEGCQEFNCLHHYAQGPGGVHGHFLLSQPHVVQLIEQHRPEFAAWARQRNAPLPGAFDVSG
jgi:Fe-S-cluster containining protein